MSTKKCNKCLQKLPQSSFYKRNDGNIRYACKECEKARRRIENMSDNEIDAQCKRSSRSYINRVEKDPDYKKKKYNKGKDMVYTRRSTYKKNASTKKLPFSLTDDQFEKITSSRCHYCNQFSTGKDFCGIDRKDSSKGYVIDNCTPCCKTCNYAKRKLTPEQYVGHCVTVVKNSKRNKD